MRTLILLVLLYACAPNPARAELSARDRELNSIESKAKAAIIFCKAMGSKDSSLKCYVEALTTIREVASQRSIEEQPKLNQHN